MAITTSKKVYAWGENSNGQLGISPYGKISVPQIHEELTRHQIKILVSGGCYGLALVADGSLLGWGYKNSDCLGDTVNNGLTTILRKEDYKKFGGISEICTGNDHAVALTRDGTLLSWGCGVFAQNGTRQTLKTPTVLKLPREGEGSLPERNSTKGGEPRVVFIATGINNSFAMREDGLMFSWGIGLSGQLGMKVDGTWGAPRALFLKFQIPPPRYEEMWHEIFQWIFLGFGDQRSIFSELNVEIIFSLVSLYLE
ncbi:MAG: hypothetical protein LW878_12950 [Proteobacteria bacterium]|nr:hypothetical protein [Pseudomonadota bacterium]